MGGANTKVSFLPELFAENWKKNPINLIGDFKEMQEKKQLAKEGFSEWNTDGDDKYLTFEEFDAGMKSLGITKERFKVSLCHHYPSSGQNGTCSKTYTSKAFIG